MNALQRPEFVLHFSLLPRFRLLIEAVCQKDLVESVL